ncbi:Transposase and inactivated derivatives [Neisseria dentiae]|nr:Transposase and inactivated derivatives [Neisseria dentiae]
MQGSRGGQAVDNRRFINTIFWILRTGAHWRNLPLDYGGWINIHHRFICWYNKGIWTKLVLILSGEQRYEVIDATHI